METQDGKDAEKELDGYRKEYEGIKERIGDIGFICKGSITERRIPCGTPGCACHKDPEKRHGPYYQLSWKEKGKTLSHFLSSENVELYRQWIQNRRKLMDLIGEMEAVSRKAGDCIRSAGDRKSGATKKAGKQKKPTKKTGQPGDMGH